MRGWRTVLSGACAVALAALAVTGCGGSDSSSSAASTTASSGGPKPKVAFVCATSTIAFFSPVEQGAKDAANAVGVDLDYTGIGASDITGPALAKTFTAAVNQHPDALVVCNFFPDAVDPLVKKAVADGIPVFGGNSVTNLLDDGAISVWGQPDEQAGEGAGDQMAEAGVTYGLCVNDVPNNPAVAARCTGFERAMKARGLKVKTLNLANANNNPTAILADVKGALQANPDVDGVLALGPTQGPAVVQAVEQTGKSGDVKVASFDVSSNIISQIRDGRMLFTVWQQPYLEGYMPVIAAAQYLKYGMAPPGQGSTGPAFITKDNLDKIKAALAAGLT
jgi:simple sugar transport system substrate-binding protein